MKKIIASFIFFFAWKKAFIIFPLVVFFSNYLYAQAPSIQWQKCLGGSADDLGLSVQQTSDGGYIQSGNTVSYDGDVSGWHGSFDYWVVKTDGSGNIQWQKCLGGSGMDFGRGIHQTTDGGYIVTGDSYSNDGDVSGNHGGGDAWVVKLDASGNIQWQKCLGGSSSEVSRNVDQSSDGGYIVVGSTASYNGDVSGHHGSTNNYDYWIVKLDPLGNIQWQKCLGGLNDDIGYNFHLTSDGGYIVSGYSYSNDGDVSGHHGSASYYDYWIVKLDASRNIQWQKSLGGSMDDIAHPVRQTSDGGYIAAGYSDSNDGDVSGNHGNSDEWIVKLDASGNIQWQKCLGGSNQDVVHFIAQTTDGGYIVSGFSYSNDGDVNGNHGSSDVWVVKLDASGNIQWQKCLGGTGDDSAFRVRETTDGGYAVGGWTQSNDGDVSGNHGHMDYWLVKLTGCTMAQPGPITGNSTGYCAGSSQNYSIAAVSGATGYTWAVPNGWAITSGQGTISVTATTGTTGGNISVTVNYSCGSITKTLAAAGASPMVTPQISIASNPGNTVCTGSSVTFTATPTNGGTNPSYQWKVNGNNVSTNSPTFTSTSLTTGQVVSCAMTSTLACANPVTVISNNISITINQSIVPTITISQTSCNGNTIGFTANMTNGGTNPSYLWSFTGPGTATNFTGSNFTLNNAANGAQVQCSLTSNANCVNPASVTSIPVTVNCIGAGVVSPANLNFQVYPNPANQSTLITFYLGASARISLDLFNIVGQQIAILEGRVLNSGNQILPLNTEKLAAGVYFVRLRTVNYKIAKKLVVVH